MKNSILKIALFMVLTTVCFSCSEDDEETVKRNDSSIIPETSFDRDNIDSGTVYLENREVTISAWDHGTIDGDIVSIVVNGRIVLDEYTLDGPDNKISVSTTLEYNGYNYILLYAHNEGSISPNTATISIDDGSVNEEFTLESNLYTNGAVNLVVD